MIICNSDRMNSGASFWLLAAEYPTLVQSIKHVMCRTAPMLPSRWPPPLNRPYHRCCHGNVGTALTPGIWCRAQAYLIPKVCLALNSASSPFNTSARHTRSSPPGIFSGWLRLMRKHKHANAPIICVLGHALLTFIRATAISKSLNLLETSRKKKL